MLLNNPGQIIHNTMRLVESNRRSEIKLNANGGNSILMICDPIKEMEYVAHLQELLPRETYSIIDLNKCLIDFVSSHKEELVELYDLLQASTHEIFKAPAGEESQDLFKKIMAFIHQAYQEGKIPTLVHAGALYGTGIHNIHIVEHEIVMKAELPLIILYPASIEPDRIMFLGKQPASKYRCMIVQ